MISYNHVKKFTEVKMLLLIRISKIPVTTNHFKAI